MCTHLLIQPRKRSWYFEWAAAWIVWAVIVGRDKALFFFSSTQGSDPPWRQNNLLLNGHSSSLSDWKHRSCESYHSFPPNVEMKKRWSYTFISRRRIYSYLVLHNLFTEFPSVTYAYMNMCWYNSRSKIQSIFRFEGGEQNNWIKNWKQEDVWTNWTDTEGKNAESMEWESSRTHGLTPDRILLMMMVMMTITMAMCAFHFQPMTILFVFMTTCNAWQSCT